MSDADCSVAIPDLPSAGGLDPAGYVIVSQGGAVYKTTLSALAALLAKRSVVSVAGGDYTITADDGTVVFTAAGRALLPTAVGIEGCTFEVKRLYEGAGVVEIVPDGTEEIDGIAESMNLNVNYQSLVLKSDGANWITSS